MEVLWREEGVVGQGQVVPRMDVFVGSLGLVEEVGLLVGEVGVVNEAFHRGSVEEDGLDVAGVGEEMRDEAVDLVGRDAFDFAELVGTEKASELASVSHNLDGSGSSDAPNELQFGGVGGVEVEDGVFLDFGVGGLVQRLGGLRVELDVGLYECIRRVVDAETLEGLLGAENATLGSVMEDILDLPRSESLLQEG